MDRDQLYNDLEELAEWADSNIYEVPINLPAVLRKAQEFLISSDPELPDPKELIQYGEIIYDKETEICYRERIIKYQNHIFNLILRNGKLYRYYKYNNNDIP